MKEETNSDGRSLLRTLKESLPIPLTNDERLEIGLRLAQTEGELADHDDRASEIKTGLKADEAKLRASISQLSTQLRNGHRLTDVDVEIWADFESNAAVYIRKDSGKELRRRALDASERQGVLLPETGDGLPSGVTRAEGHDNDDHDSSDEAEE